MSLLALDIAVGLLETDPAALQPPSRFAPSDSLLGSPLPATPHSELLPTFDPFDSFLRPPSTPFNQHLHTLVLSLFHHLLFAFRPFAPFLTKAEAGTSALCTPLAITEPFAITNATSLLSQPLYSRPTGRSRRGYDNSTGRTRQPSCEEDGNGSAIRIGPLHQYHNKIRVS